MDWVQLDSSAWLTYMATQVFHRYGYMITWKRLRQFVFSHLSFLSLVKFSDFSALATVRRKDCDNLFLVIFSKTASNLSLVKFGDGAKMFCAARSAAQIYNTLLQQMWTRSRVSREKSCLETETKRASERERQRERERERERGREKTASQTDRESPQAPSPSPSPSLPPCSTLYSSSTPAPHRTPCDTLYRNYEIHYEIH
jgi:hypothetical protein